MSWLFNERLSNIKGQITSLASGVFTDGILNDSGDQPSKNNEEVTNHVTNHAAKDESKRNEREIQDDWSWEPVESEQSQIQNIQNSNSQLITDLRKQIETLENERDELRNSLEQLDWDCQQTTERIVSLKDDLQADYNKINTEFADLKRNHDKLLNKEAQHILVIEQLKDKNSNLQKELDSLKSSAANISKDGTKEVLNAVDARKLQNEFEKLKSYSEKLESELDISRQTLLTESKEKGQLVAEIEQLKHIKKEDTLKVKEYERTHLLDQEEFNKLALILQGYEEQVRTYKKQCEALQLENESLKKNVVQKTDDGKYEECLKLNECIEQLKRQNSDVLKDKEAMHKRYVDLATDSFKQFMDYPLPLDKKNVGSHDNPQMFEFVTVVETILKLLLELKWKTETLKKEVDDMTEEKTKILTEKNYEIERLIKNSEILSQEVITKSQELKHYEEECSEVVKNNELLINELENYKNSSGLQTISESNEDNLLLLESQLENANKQIKDLELTLSDVENSKQENNLEIQTELDYIKKQLNITGTELSQTKNEYQKLLDEFNKQKVEYISLKNDYDISCNEKEDLSITVDKIQQELENADYKYSELNVDVENLKEEIEFRTGEVTNLIKTNKKLENLNSKYESQIESIQNEVEDLKQQLIAEAELREQHQLQIRNLTEKLQNAKMSETGLKLQNDTIHKELLTITESKQNLEVKFNQLSSSLCANEAMLQTLREENVVFKDKIAQMESICLENNDLLKKNDEYLQQLRISQEKLSQYEEHFNQYNPKELLAANEDLLGKLKSSEDKILEFEKIMKDEYVNKNRSNEQDSNKLMILEQTNSELKANTENLHTRLESVNQEKLCLEGQLKELGNTLAHNATVTKEYIQRIKTLEDNINEINTSRNELISLVTTKHQESIQYHNEIQRLNKVLSVETEKCEMLENQLQHIDRNINDSEQIAKKNEEISQKNEEIATKNEAISKKDEEIDKLSDQNNFLREKCEVLAQNLLQEQSKVQQVLSERNAAASEKELSLSRELERLRAHLLEIEEMYTKELLLAETKNQEMQAKVNETEQREKDSSTLYTSVNIRTNQQVETLQTQLQLVTNQRDELRKKMSDAEDQIGKKSAALSNLQFVLEQFQKDKEKDVYHETERIRRQINVEKQIQQDLRNEISSLNVQLEESKKGLLAASRLSDQVENSRQQITSLKDEVSKLQQKLSKTEEINSSLVNQTDAKVDKMLIRNLVVGFVSSNPNTNKDQHQILKLLATVLDFSQQDNEKVNLNKPQQGSWLTSILHPQSYSGPNISQESLSQAFVRFLENESKPRQLPNLLESANPNSASKNGESGGASSRQSPILLSEVVLPTFADFGQNRNSSSILKDVLKDNN